MALTYIFAVFFTFGFSLVGLLINNAIKDKPFYRHLSNFNFIKSEKVNRYLGVLLFKKVLLNSFWKHFNATVKIKERPDRKKLIALRNEMTHAEIGHLIAFVCVIFVAILLRPRKHLYQDAFIPILVCNVIFHIYPPLLQQYNKRRLDTVINRVSR